MIPPAAHPRTLHCRWHKGTCPGMCCSLPAPSACSGSIPHPAAPQIPSHPSPAQGQLPGVRGSRHTQHPHTGPGSQGTPLHPWVSRLKVEEEERCRDTAPEDVAGVSVVWMLCWGFVCLLVFPAPQQKAQCGLSSSCS